MIRRGLRKDALRASERMGPKEMHRTILMSREGENLGKE